MKFFLPTAISSPIVPSNKDVIMEGVGLRTFLTHKVTFSTIVLVMNTLLTCTTLLVTEQGYELILPSLTFSLQVMVESSN